MKKRTVLVSGFAGIGGFDLAACLVGWETGICCEIDPECQVVLRHHFPEAYIHGDIRTLTGKIIDEEIKRRFGDEPVRVVWTSGFPCQPFSAAGKREGVDDNRYLWPEVARIIGEYRFDAIVLENVLGLTSILEPAVYAEMEREAAISIRSCEIGLFDEPAKREKVEIAFEVVQQRVMGQILQDIGEAGYETPKASDGTPIVLCVPACAVGAPHRRDRVWFVGNSRRKPRDWREDNLTGEGEQHRDRVRDGGEEADFIERPVEEGSFAHAIGGRVGIGENGGKCQEADGIGASKDVDCLGSNKVAPHPHGVDGDSPGLHTGQVSQLEEAGIPIPFAYPAVAGPEERVEAGGPPYFEEEGTGLEHEPERSCGWGDASHTDGIGLRGQGYRQGVASFTRETCEGGFWANFPTEWPLRLGDDGLSAGLGGVCVPGTGKRVTASNLNKFTLKGGGNAIVPQVAVSIFRALEATWEDR